MLTFQYQGTGGSDMYSHVARDSRPLASRDTRATHSRATVAEWE
jgi:hypothetical protein